MSKPVTNIVVGKKFFSSLLFPGHPSVEKGHNPDENQVSKTSVSLLRDPSGLLLNLLKYFSFASSSL